MHKEVKTLKKKLGKQGWKFAMSKHLKAFPPDSVGHKDYIAIPLTPSDKRALLNTKGYLKKRGFHE